MSKNAVADPDRKHANSRRLRRYALYLGALGIAGTLLLLNRTDDLPQSLVSVDGELQTRDSWMDKAKKDGQQKARAHAQASQKADRAMRDRPAGAAAPPRARTTAAARSKGATKAEGATRAVGALRPDVASLRDPAAKKVVAKDKAAVEPKGRRKSHTEMALESSVSVRFDPSWNRCDEATECVAFNTGCQWEFAHRDAMPAIRASGYGRGGVRMKCVETHDTRPPLVACVAGKCERQ